MKKLRLKGSYTVEASFLMPMILTVIVLIIYLAFFLHDRALLQSAAYTSCLRGSQMTEGEDVYAQVEKSSRELIRNRLLATGSVETDIEIGSDRISVSYRGMLKIPAGTLLSRLIAPGRENIQVCADATADCFNPVGFVRKCRILESWGSALGNAGSGAGGSDTGSEEEKKGLE